MASNTNQSGLYQLEDLEPLPGGWWSWRIVSPIGTEITNRSRGDDEHIQKLIKKQMDRLNADAKGVFKWTEHNKKVFKQQEAKNAG